MNSYLQIFKLYFKELFNRGSKKRSTSILITLNHENDFYHKNGHLTIFEYSHEKFENKSGYFITCWIFTPF